MGYIPPIPRLLDFRYLLEIETQILPLTNSEREKSGVPALAWSDDLRLISRYKSNEMLQFDYFAHDSPYTGRPYELARNFFNYPFSFFGENIQMAEVEDIKDITATALFDKWLKSPSHRVNILNRNFTKMGVGIVYAEKSRKFYSSQMLSD